MEQKDSKSETEAQQQQQGVKGPSFQHNCTNIFWLQVQNAATNAIIFGQQIF